MKWTERHSQNAVAAKARKRIAMGEAETMPSARGLAMEQAMREGREPLNPLDAREFAYWKLLEGLRPAFKAASQVEAARALMKQRLFEDFSGFVQALIREEAERRGLIGSGAELRENPPPYGKRK